MFTTSLLPRRQLLLRRLLAEFTTDRRGRFLVVTGPHGVNKEHFIREFATKLGEFEVNHRLKKKPRLGIVVVDDIHLAEREDIEKTLTLVHTKGLIVLSTAPHRISGATDLLALPPLTVPETALLARQIVGHCTPATAHRLNDAAGGLPQLIRELLDAAPIDHWSTERPSLTVPEHWVTDIDVKDAVLREVASHPFFDGCPVDDLDVDAHVEHGTLIHENGILRFHSPEVRTLVRASTPPSKAQHPREESVEKLIESGNLPLARLHVEALPHSQAAEQRAFLALYGGQSFEAQSDSPFYALATWDPIALRGINPTFDMFADALDTGSYTKANCPQDPAQQQIHNFISGWLALVYDDPLNARRLLSRKGPSDLVGLWQSAFLARAHYVLGEFQEASAVVERGLATGDRTGASLLEPVHLWTGAQVAAMSGRTELANHYLQRLTVPEDAFLIQKLSASMGKLITASMTSDTRTASLAGDRMASVVYTTNTQQPGFWAWEDMYAISLIRTGRIDAAAAVMDGIPDSTIPSLRARNLVPQANIEIQRGSTARGVKMLSEAVELISTVNMPAYEARILFEYGLVLRRMGRRSQAAEIFTRAEEVFIAMGAVTLAARCHGEKKVAGVGGARRSAQGLTPQEEQITALVVDGYSNQEVARELSLSAKTVEYHLTRVYKKMGVTSRAELRELLKV
ncbi:helix-turn-helix domain-containing protein [Corynebacterium crudilactis]|uniref:Helix-turn-helix transcriptional regulator n=1 Tax=Corynebacterium crudilactis TaxID=1652495 RepID=A0A172QVF5_9CORY|nr:LuxR C-terminal-related transcriptional regulator [Corynebacterium crudilactis]ANE04618.1 helix-turn-helix transcriptional regulator [Corynebacterium crudilactis]